MAWGMKFSGLVPQTIAVNAVNASCEIILLFWNLGSGVYVFLFGSYYITAGCCGVPIWPYLNGVVFTIIVACTGSCISKCFLNFLFSFGAVLALFLARLSFGGSYHSGGCYLSYSGWVGSVLALILAE